MVNAELVSLKKVNQFDGYNAFTDLTFFEGHFWLVFRTGTGHVSPAGKVVIYRSKDANDWKEVQVLSQTGVDLRDPRVLVMNNSLHVLCFSLDYNAPGISTRFTPDSCYLFKWTGKQFEQAHVFKREELPLILWDLAKIEEGYYIGGYNFDLGHSVFNLVRSKNLDAPYELVSSFNSLEIPPNMGITEVDFVKNYVQNGQYYFLCRIDRDSINRVGRKKRKEAKRAYKKRKKSTNVRPVRRKDDYFAIVYSQYPFTSWDTTIIRKYIKGPRGIVYEGKLLVCGRYKEKGDRKRSITLFEYKNHDLEPILTLAKGKDGSYAGLEMNPKDSNELLISFYSDHERIGTLDQGKLNDIWIARIKLN